MPFSAREAAAWCQGRLEGPGEKIFQAMEFLSEAGPEQLTFIGHPSYARAFVASRASGAVCTNGLAVSRRPEQTLIWVPNADLAVAQILEKLAPPPPWPPPGVHPSAVIHAGAVLGQDVRIGPQVVIQAGAVIGERTVLMAQDFIGAGACLGADCVLWPQVVVRDGCTLGQRVILHPGCIIGADGFGYRFAAGRHIKIPQIGGVIIEDDCELGANTTVDRGKFSHTVIGRGSKLDNLVQVGHNARIGRHSILVAHTAVGGSVRAGDYLMMGGGSVVGDHLELGEAVRVAAFSAVARDTPAGQAVAGAPARPAREFFAQLRAYYRLPQLAETVRRLEERIAELESSPKNDSP